MISLPITSPSDADQRIDKFLKKYLPNAPLGGIYKWLRTGKVKVNKKKVDQTYRIEEGDIINIHLQDEEIQNFQSLGNTKHKEDITNRAIHQRKIDILYEDDGLLIVNKPAGINVHPGDHKTKEVSLIELVQDFLGEKYNTLSFKPALIHRIDRDTSGVLMIAKEKRMLESLLSLLQNGKIQKIYHALVVGATPKPRDTICAKLLRIENAHDEAKVQINEKGQDAVTHYRTLQENILEKYSLLEVRIETGRTHQIRVHLASLGSPILGDHAYGNRSENSFARREYHIDRQILHAYSLSFIHPKTKETILVHAPYAEDMYNLMNIISNVPHQKGPTPSKNKLK